MNWNYKKKSEIGYYTKKFIQSYQSGYVWHWQPRKKILAVGYEDKTIKTQVKWNQLNIMDIQSLLGTNHRPPLSYMDKSYIWIEETNQRINEFSIGYMMNTNLIINKAFREQVKVCLKTTFSTSTLSHISKIWLKPDTRVIALVMFFDNRKKMQRKCSECWVV